MDSPVVKIPSNDIRVKLPLSMAESDVEILFMTPEAIDDTIERLQLLKNNLKDLEFPMYG